MNNISIMILGLIGVVILYFTRKMQENEKPQYIVSVQYVSMALVVILSGYSQYQSSKEEKKFKIATHEVAVLSQVSEKLIPLIDNIAKVQNKIWVVKNYLSFEKAKKEHHELAIAFNWHKIAGESRVAELYEAKEAFKNIKFIAAEIVKLNIEYQGIVPAETLKWANFTLNLSFEEIDQYLDPYAPIGESPNKSVLMYHKKTGKAFSLVIGKIRAASDLLERI